MIGLLIINLIQLQLFFPKETEQVIEVLKLCNEFKYPLIGSGGRTGLSGGASATSEELIVSFDKMNSILNSMRIQIQFMSTRFDNSKFTSFC